MKTLTTTYAGALTLGYNVVQVKYGGILVRIEVSRGQGRIYSCYDNSDVGHFTYENEEVAATFMGNLVDHHVVLFDCTSFGYQPKDALRLEHTSIKGYAYRDRFALLRDKLLQMQGIHGAKLSLAVTRPSAAAPAIWDTLSTIDLTVTGLIFRKTSDTYDAPILTVRWYHNIPGALV